MLSTVPETVNVPVPPALSVAVTGNESAPCVTGDPAVVTALLYPYVTPPIVQLDVHLGRDSAVTPAFSALTSAVTVAMPLAGAPASDALA